MTKTRNQSGAPLRIAGLHLLFGFCWILFSDLLLAVFVTDRASTIYVQMAKGWLYVIGTSAFVYVMVRRHVRRSRRYEARLLGSLEEKEVLLREVHHRVRNNLQVISSILSLQSRTISDEESKAAFRNCILRIKSMSLAHQQIYGAADVSRIRLDSYLQNLARLLRDTYGRPGIDVQVDVENGDFVVSLEKALICGLAVNELLVNGIVHGIPDGGAGRVTLVLREEAGNIAIAVRDTGPGYLPHDLPPGPESLGALLVQTLSEQLDGNVNYRIENGTHVTLSFRK